MREDQSIKQFILNTGATFKPGKGFYELSKTEKISHKKQVILQHVSSGTFSLEMLKIFTGLPTSGTGHLQRNQRMFLRVILFIQSSHILEN